MKVICSDCGRKGLIVERNCTPRTMDLIRKYSLYLCTSCKWNFYFKKLEERAKAESKTSKGEKAK